MKKSKLLSLVTAAFFLFTASVSFAETITVYIIVKVATVDDSDNLLGGSISVEDIITGEYTYESTTSDSNALATVGDYRHTSSPFGITINADGFVFETDPSNVDFLVEIVNNHSGPPRDNYLLRSYNNLDLPNGVLVDHISWQLDDETATALSSEDLPTAAPNLEDWQSVFGLTITGSDPMDPLSTYSIRGNVTVAGRDMQIVEIITNMSGNPKAGDPIMFTAICLGGKSVYYKFLYRAGYGTAAYSANPWIVMQDTSNNYVCNHSLPSADNYVVVVQATDDPGGWTGGDPQGGITVNVESP